LTSYPSSISSTVMSSTVVSFFRCHILQAVCCC
jgi:hypothetical protein